VGAKRDADEVSARVSQEFLTVWTHCLFGEVGLPPLVLFRAGAPVRLKFASRRSGYQSRSGRIIHDLTPGSGFVGSAMADLLGSDFSLAGERICGGYFITFCSAALTTKSEFWSSAVTIVLGYLLSTSGLLDLIATSGGGGRDSESVQVSYNVSYSQ
jgi:hypothetical protein